MTAGTLISRSFSVWSRNFGRFAALQLVLLVPASIIGALVSKAFLGVYFLDAREAASILSSQGPGKILLANGATFALMLPFILVQVGGVAEGAIRHLAGAPVRLGGMFGAGVRCMGTLFVAAVLITLACMVGYVLLIVPGFIVAVATGLTMPVVVAERLGPVAAIKRSLFLTRGHRWSIFAAFAVTMGLLLGASVAAGIVSGTAPVLGRVLSAIVSAIFGPLSMVASAVASHDLRAAKEGADTRELQRVFE